MQRACRLDQLSEGKTYPADVDDVEVVLVLLGGQVYALEDNCSHQDFPLSQGEVLPDGRIKCRAHGAEFELATGKAVCAPAFSPVATFPVKIENGEVWVDVD